MSFWFNLHFGASPLDFFSRPYSYNPRVFPPFYRSLLLAWRSLDGSFLVSRDALVYGVSSAHVCSPVLSSSTKACYLFLLSESMVSPHCVEKFAGVYGALDWLATWCSLFFFDLDRQVCNLCWKVAHGVLYTAQSWVFRVASSSLLLLWGSCGIPGASLLFLSIGSECFLLASIFAVCFFPYVSGYFV